MKVLAAIGAFTIERYRRVQELTAVLACAVFYAARPSTWRRTIRAVLARQILFTGVEAVRFTSGIAVLVGVSVVVETQVWLGKVDQTQFLGPILVAVIVRELGPLVANLIVIGRSGNAMAAELAIMKVTGEVRILDAQGLDPFIYLLVPRVIAMAVCVFCLTMIFITVCLASGYLCGLVVGIHSATTRGFISSVASAIGPLDVMNVLLKSIVPGALSGTICCLEGLHVSHAITEVPPASSRAVQRSVVALFLISVTVSLLTYL